MYRLLCGTPAGSGSYDFAQRKIDRCTAFEAAKKAIGREAARILIWVYEDWPLRSIQWRLRIGCHRTAARRIAEHAGALADHYAEIDERSGRSATPYTTAAAIKLVDPDDPEP